MGHLAIVVSNSLRETARRCGDAAVACWRLPAPRPLLSCEMNARGGAGHRRANKTAREAANGASDGVSESSACARAHAARQGARAEEGDVVPLVSILASNRSAGWSFGRRAATFKPYRSARRAWGVGDERERERDGAHSMTRERDRSRAPARRGKARHALEPVEEKQGRLLSWHEEYGWYRVLVPWG